jgi:hypothetical protein
MKFCVVSPKKTKKNEKRKKERKERTFKRKLIKILFLPRKKKRKKAFS